MSTEETSSGFCLWDEWYEIEEELAGVAPTVRAQYDAMRRVVLKDCSGPTGPAKEPATGEKETPVERGTPTPNERLAVEEGDSDNVHKKEPDPSD